MLASRITAPLLLILTASALEPETNPKDAAQAAEAKAVEFLKREVPAWSRDNGCFSCHNNGDAARALYAANQNGYSIPRQVLADTSSWLARPNGWKNNKGDPGFSDKRLANIQFGAALLAAIEAGHVSDRRSLALAASLIKADQEADGSWPIDVGNAPGSPATYGTPLATWTALVTLEAAGILATREPAEKAKRWLSQARLHNLPAVAARLLAAAGESGQLALLRRQECLTFIRRAQTVDGGWGPYQDSPSEPFDTAVVLLALAKVRHELGIEECIQRGRSFLAAQQSSDGSWPATTRPTGGDSYAQKMSTSSWATLALLATRQ